SDNLSVKMYLFKTPHKYTRLKYGQTIMSLLRPDQKEHELIIAAITRRSNALAAFEALRDFLGCGNLGDFATEAKVEGRDSIFGFESNEWNHLSEKSRTKSPFFGSMRRKSISIKQYPDKLILKWFWDRWIMALFLLAFSGFCYFGAYYLFEISIRGFFFLLSGLGLGTLFGYPGLRILLTAEKITLNNWNSTINIRSGFFPFTNSLTVSTEQIRVRIYRCHNSHANKAMKPGYTLLSLLNNKTPNLEFILAAASKKSLLTPAYEMLIEFLKQPFCDETLEEIELSDGQVINVSTDALTGGGDAQDKKRSFRLLSTNSVSFSRNWNNIIVGFSLAGLMLMGLIAALCSGDNGEEPSIGGKIFLVTLGLAFFALGAGFAIYSWRTRHIIVDKMNDIVSYKGFINSPSKGKLLCAISDIAAVQVCSVLGTITSGQSSREITVYEINVVLKNSGNKRINILASQNYSQIQDDATGFADFLGVPLLDHT
ncbi:MAG: hypothetical protein OEW48_20195, partial [Phycisphaerae bacterium]|nr:hypothetical protein [Phycisphaerae bacterium]